MKSRKLFVMVLTITSFSTLVTPPTFSDTLKNNPLTIYQVMQYVLDRYPSLKISEMEVAQATEQRQQVESSLGWILNSSAGISRELSGLGTPSDSLDVNGSVSRQLKSGATLSLSGGYRYEDSSLSYSPILPNPAHTTKLDLSYRLPLSQGEGNPQYLEGIVSSEAGYDLAKANQLLTRISLAEKVKDLFYASALTYARLLNAKEAVERSRKLEAYIYKNFNLGLSEEKDRLQSRAQLRSRLADLSAIQLTWQQQKTSLNRLMLENWEQELQPRLLTPDNKHYDINEIIHITKDYHPAVKISQANLDIAESQIISAKDTKKDNLDLVLSIGSRTSDGKNTAGSTISEKDLAGAIRLEYRHLFDDKGVNSKYKQAQLQKYIALQDIKKVNDDIRYTVAGLVAEINAAKLAVKTAYQKLQSESLKLKEAEQRYRRGRADIAQLIQFQNEYSLSELAYQNQKIDLNNRVIALEIFSGRFWISLNQGSSSYGVIK